MNEFNILLDSLRNDYHAVSLRIDIAAEIYTDNDIKALCYLAEKNNLSITIKIGGCDSMAELYLAKKYRASSIIAPMIETINGQVKLKMLDTKLKFFNFVQS